MFFKLKKYKTSYGVTFTAGQVQAIRNQVGKKNDVISLPRFCADLPPDIREKLTDTEYEQWKIWKCKHDEEYRTQQLDLFLRYLPTALTGSAVAISEGVDPSDAELIWSAIDALQKSLEKAGFNRPAKRRGRPVGESTATIIESPVPLPNLLQPGTQQHQEFHTLQERLYGLLQRNISDQGNED